MRGLIKRILREEQKGTRHQEGDVVEWRINPYEMKTNNYKELMGAIDNLPDTIESLTIPNEVQMFNPRKETYTPNKDSDWKGRVKKMVLGLLRRGNILSYSLNSYFGTTNKNYGDHPYYISFELPGSKEFGERMRSGAHGSLD